MIEVMPQLNVLSASPIHTVTEIQVWISSDVRDGEVYEIGEVEDDRGNKKKVYTLTKIGLDKLFLAAGIQEHKCVVESLGERKWMATFEGTWQQPDAFELPLKDTKEIDLRVGGTRWEERKLKEIGWLLRGLGRELKITWKKGMSPQRYIATVKYHLLKNDPDKFDELDFIAGEVATATVTQQAQFGAELAKSGAANRAVRKVIQVKKYTKETLDNHPFVIYRTRFDWETVISTLGKKKAEAMIESLAEKNLGLEPGTAAMLPESIEEFEDGEIVEVDVFEVSLSTETMGKIQELFEGRERTPNDSSLAIFGKEYKDLSDGEGQLLMACITDAENELGTNKSADEKTAYMQFLKNLYSKCATEKRFPTDNEVVQIPLPGIENE